MLRMLVDFFSGVVRVLAVVAIFGGAVVGFMQSNNADVEPWAGALIGFAAGFLIASVCGGILATLILIESHLRVLADAKKAELKAPSPAEDRPADEAAIERAERIAMYARQYRQPAPMAPAAPPPPMAQPAPPPPMAQPAPPPPMAQPVPPAPAAQPVQPPAPQQQVAQPVQPAPQPEQAAAPAEAGPADQTKTG